MTDRQNKGSPDSEGITGTGMRKKRTGEMGLVSISQLTQSAIPLSCFPDCAGQDDAGMEAIVPSNEETGKQSPPKSSSESVEVSAMADIRPM